MKLKLITGALIAVCLSIAAYSTTAYFTAEYTAENIITAGNVEISFRDSVSTGDEMTVMPGKQTDKIVQVENTGDHPAYIRIRLEKDIVLADGADGEVDLSLIGLDLDKENWTEKDGYYYYNTALKSGETTKPLFTKISFSKDMSDLYQNSKAAVNVYASAVQSENNGTDVTTAAGWPAE